MTRLSVFRVLAISAFALCFIVVVLGAYVRLNAAGLGCPDWPTCYGHLTAAGALENSAEINATHPDRPVDYGKAVREMVHRYAAGTLGLLIVVMAALAILNRSEPRQPVLLPLVLLGVVVVQGALGMLTVTWLLKPLIVTLHLLGGMTTLALLWWLVLRPEHRELHRDELPLRRLAIVALVILGIQIALGGWTSSNYAAVACPDFPTCQGSFLPHTDFKDAFVLWRGLGIDYEGGVLDHPARVAIHVVHRIGALLTAIVFILLAGLCVARGRSPRVRRAGMGAAAMLALQLVIGVGMVWKGFPLPLATAHNAGAALLLLSAVGLIRALTPLSATWFAGERRT
ncbi:MAG TPA: COX15/CtaA family protein [Steroidobacteraceae bacterium]|nr:COX15/CtaA family protein [Steroidobacteraceae bacterium]